MDYVPLVLLFPFTLERYLYNYFIALELLPLERPAGFIALYGRLDT